MTLLNRSAQTIWCLINDELQLVLNPHERTSIDINTTSITKLRLSHTYGSCYGDCFNLSGMCQIVLNTTFIFSNLYDDSIIYISREKVHFHFRHTYDRFFCNSDSGYMMQEVHDVADLDGLYNVASDVHPEKEVHDSLIGFLLEGHFWQTTALFILFKLCFWANGWAFPIWLILVFWGFGYLLRLASEKLFNVFQKNVGTPESHSLRKYTSSEYIEQYYANPQRKWIANDIETK